MKSIYLVIAMGLAISVSARAGQVSCDGEYMGFDFNFSARASKGQIVGKITYRITNGGDMNRNGTMQVTGSDVRPEVYLRFSGASKEGSGSVDARFESPSGLYRGILSATADIGSADVGVACSVKGSLTQQATFDPADVEEWMPWE